MASRRRPPPWEREAAGGLGAAMGATREIARPSDMPDIANVADIPDLPDTNARLRASTRAADVVGEVACHLAVMDAGCPVRDRGPERCASCPDPPSLERAHRRSELLPSFAQPGVDAEPGDRKPASDLDDLYPVEVVEHENRATRLRGRAREPAESSARDCRSWRLSSGSGAPSVGSRPSRGVSRTWRRR